MSFGYRRALMAQALSVVGEAGIHGMQYNALVDRISPSTSRQSRRFRVSLTSAHKFSAEEFEDYLILAWRFGYVERSKFHEVSFVSGKNKSSYSSEDEVVRLTQTGWEFVEAFDKPILHRWGEYIRDNLPTVFLSVFAALLSTWILFFWAPN